MTWYLNSELYIMCSHTGNMDSFWGYSISHGVDISYSNAIDKAAFMCSTNNKSKFNTCLK